MEGLLELPQADWRLERVWTEERQGVLLQQGEELWQWSLIGHVHKRLCQRLCRSRMQAVILLRASLRNESDSSARPPVLIDATMNP